MLVRRRALLLPALAAVTVVGIVLAYLVLTAGGAALHTPAASVTPNAGRAATRFGPVGFTVQVVGWQRAGGRVTVHLVFTNSSDTQQRADPQDFRLEAPGGSRERPAFGTGCPNWGRVDLYPGGSTATQPRRDADGTAAPAVWGPAALCFPEPATGDLTLLWAPDVAFALFGAETRIPLR